MGWRSKRWSHRGDDLGDLGDMFAKLWPHKMMLESSRYDKWDRGGGGGGGGGGGSGGAAPSGPWPGRDRERDRERERQARAHQMSHAHAPEPDASSLFPAPFRVTGNRDRVSQQIQTKLGDYHLAQCFIDDPSKSIGICAEPPSPAPCPPSRRESEFKKPSHAPQNGRVHHRPYYNKSEGPSSTGAPAHRPPPLRIPNGVPTQISIDSSQPPIESILKEMKSLPTPLSVIAATPRKELENKFIFNPYTNKVQENPQLTNNDLKTTLPKPGLDNRISNSRSSVSPDVVNKDLGLSESDDDVAANAHRLGPPISPIGSGSPSSSSSQSDSESESSSAGSAPATPAPAAAAVTAPQQTQQTQRSSWSLSNFAPPPAQPTDPTYDSGKELTHALAVAKGKPQSPVSEMSDSEASCGSPGARRRPAARRSPSTASSDDEAPRHHNTTSPRVLPSVTAPPLKRGRPPKAGKCEERPPKKRRGRPRKAQPPSPPPAPPAPPDSDNEPDPPTHHHTQQETKTHIFRKVFTARKVDEGGGKGGKGGKGKGGKGKGQVTIEITAPESVDDEDRRLRERSAERRQEAMARVSPPVPRPHAPHGSASHGGYGPSPHGPSPHGSRDADRRRSADRIDRPPDRLSTDRIQTERTSNDRIPTAIGRSPSKDRIATERTSNDRISDRATDRVSHDRLPDRTMSDRLSDRLSSERLAEKVTHDRLAAERIAHERLTAEKLAHERLAAEKLVHERLAAEKLAHERLEAKMNSRLPDKMVLDRLADTKASLDRLGESKTSIDRLADNKMSIDRLGESKVSIDRLADNKMSIDRLGENKLSIERVAESKLALERGKDGKEAKLERFVRAEADVGSGLKPGRGSERLEDPSSNVLERRRTRLLVKVPLCRLRPQTVAALQHSPLRRQPPKQAHTPHAQQAGEVAATNHERTAACGQTPIYYSYFERLPADAHSDDERDHKFYLEEAKRLRLAGEGEQEPLARVMLYLESVLCFVLTGRVLELELDTKRAFTVYRETIEYINSIDSMPQCFRVEPHSTFNKLDILSLRVRALLYLRMFKMYNRDVKEYSKIVQDYQQKPACAESVSSVSPLSPTPSPAGSVGSVGSGASSGYCSLHAVPAHAHQALLQLTKYYSFLHVAHDLWEQADGLCRHRAYRDLFIAVDRKCGPLSLSSTFRHLVQYVRHAISLLKNAPAE